MRRRLKPGLVVRASVLLAIALTALVGSGTGSAVNLTLPSLWQSYQGYFTMGTFGDWTSAQALYHYRSNAIPNNLKLDSQIGTSATNSLSRQAYVAAVAQINADPTLTPEQKAAAIEVANQHIVLQATTGAGQAETILKAIEAYNATNHLTDDTKKVVRGHVFAWHGGQQPNWFFCNGFTFNSANPDWASPSTMLARLDNYIHAMTDKYAKYSDVIVSWDVVNEAVDDYTGQIRNATTPQVSQWGRIFRRPDLDGDPDARLAAESVWVRQAFSSARTWANADGVHWKLYYNDFQDSDKLYEPKMSQTIKMLKPIHDAGNIDGYGMQGRLAYAYPTIAMLKAQIDAGLTVADEISISESDIRSDFEPNPNYDPSQPSRAVVAADAADPSHQWPTWGSCSWNSRASANGNTFDVCNSPVRRIPAWGTGSNNTLANSTDIMHKQADFAADWMDLLLSYPGKIKYYDFDGTSDSATFNSTTGGHLWSGLSGNPEKSSFFAVIGAPRRLEMRNAIARADAIADPSQYTPQSWQLVVNARAAAAALVSVRIYLIGDVNNVKNATTALNSAIDGLVLGPVTTASVAPPAPDGLNGWYVTAPTITLTATAGAGVASTQYAIDGGSWQTYTAPFSVATDGSHTIQFATTDSLGNMEVPKSIAVKVDLTDPTSSASISPAEQNGWYASPSVTLTIHDGAGSGLDHFDYALDGGAYQVYTGPVSGFSTGNHFIQFHSTDLAGRVESTTNLVAFKVDAQAPTVTITAPADGATYPLDKVVTAKFKCIDNQSGIDTCVGSTPNGANLDTSTVGAHSLTVTGTDRAGNRTVKTVTYQVQYTWNGFFSPITNTETSTLNLVHAGDLVKLGFSLNGDRGPDVFAAGSPTSVPVTCPSWTPHSVPAAGAGASPGLSFGVSSGHYSFGWQTSTGWAGTCREFQIGLNDGTTTLHRATFMFFA